MNHVTLNNGLAMPLLGFGVFQITDAVVCEQHRLAVAKRRDGVVGERLRAEGGVIGAAHVRAAAKCDHVVEGRDAAAGA